MSNVSKMWMQPVKDIPQDRMFWFAVEHVYNDKSDKYVCSGYRMEDNFFFEDGSLIQGTVYAYMDKEPQPKLPNMLSP